MYVKVPNVNIIRETINNFRSINKIRALLGIQHASSYKIYMHLKYKYILTPIKITTYEGKKEKT